MYINVYVYIGFFRAGVYINILGPPGLQCYPIYREQKVSPDWPGKSDDLPGLDIL